MIKKTILIILLSILVLSCGKKGDPKYETNIYINPLFKIIWCTIKKKYFMLKIFQLKN